MDVEESARVLGIPRDATKDVLRRAYLRAVRAHPPERDPEGFQRVRLAYECLLPFAPVDAHGPAGPARATAKTGSVGSDIRATPTSDAEAAPSPRVDAFESFVVAQGSNDEQPSFRAILSEDWKSAAEILVEFYARPPRPDRPFPYPGNTLQVVLELYRARQPNRAARLFRAFEDFTNKNAGWSERVSPVEAARWTLLREFLELRDIASPELLEALADGIADDDYDEAIDALTAWTESNGSLVRFSTAAPTLYTVMSGEPPERTKRKSAGVLLEWAARLAFVMLLVRYCGDDEEPSTAPARAQVATAPHAAPTVAPSEPPRPHTLSSPEARIREAIAIGDCGEVRELFPTYRATNETTSRAALRVRALEMCPELAEVLVP